MSRSRLLAAALAASAAAPAAAAHARRAWNSWDSESKSDPHGNSNETKTLSVAAFLSEKLLPSGYNLLTIDEGWAWYGGQQSQNASLDAYGRPYPRIDQYPSAAGGAGFAPLAARLKAMGLELGLWHMRGIPRAAAAARMPIAGSNYTADEAVDPAAPNACSWNGYTFGCKEDNEGRCVPAAVAYYQSIAALYAAWGVSFVKVDCMWGGAPGQYDADLIAFTSAFKEVGGIDVSLSPGIGVSAANITFLTDNHLAVQTRVTGDFWDSWSALKVHISVAEQFEPFFAAADAAQFACYPDLDMLCIGDIIVNGALAPSRFTPSETRLLVSLWSFVGAPLIMGGDLPPSPASAGVIDLLTNPAVLATHGAARSRRVLRPTAGGPGAHAWASAPAGAADASAYFLLINANDAPANVTVSFADVPWAPPGQSYCATDLWSGATLPARFSTSATFFDVLPAHAAGVYHVAGC